jgi:hypothetical protein
MSATVPAAATTHGWLHRISLAIMESSEPGPAPELLAGLREAAVRRGCDVTSVPTDASDVCVTTLPFLVPVDWRESVQLTVRRRYGLKRTPMTFGLMWADADAFEAAFDHLAKALTKDPIDPADFVYEGLMQSGIDTLVEQGMRGGPMLSLMRVLQAQSKCVRIILVVGRDEPQAAFYLDLVGGHPRVAVGTDPRAFYDDMVTRIETAAGSPAVTAHVTDEELVPSAAWTSATTPGAMRRAGHELGRRSFFTQMVRVADLVAVPAVDDAIADQYSEGCFATWDPALHALVSTATGSAKPVDKTELQDEDLAVIRTVRDDKLGAIVRHVEGHAVTLPSSEAVELRDVDLVLPSRTLGDDMGELAGEEVPAIRSKLHGHRGVSSFDPAVVEFVPLPAAYYDYPVSCATGAQAAGVRDAFAASQAFRDPDDRRTLAFTILPTHGIVIGEAWRPGKAPFDLIFEAIDSGALVISDAIPQGRHTFELRGGRMVLVDPTDYLRDAPLSHLEGPASR